MNILYTYFLIISSFTFFYTQNNFVNAVIDEHGEQHVESKEVDKVNVVVDDDEDGDYYHYTKRYSINNLGTSRSRKRTSSASSTHGEKPCCNTKKSTELDSFKSCACANGVFFIVNILPLVLNNSPQLMEFLLALCALAGLSILSPVVKGIRECVRDRYLKVNGCIKFVIGSNILFLLSFLSYVIDFYLMLIIMSFNIAVFIVICAAYSIGYLISSFIFIKLSGSNISPTNPVDMECC